MADTDKNRIDLNNSSVAPTATVHSRLVQDSLPGSPFNSHTESNQYVNSAEPACTSRAVTANAEAKTKPGSLAPAVAVASPYASWWQAGYEGADHINGAGSILALNEATWHIQHAAEDYASLARFGMRTVRESIGWRIVEKDGAFDFSSLASRIDAACAQGIQILWTFCHYGWPSDIDVYSPAFITRFAEFCERTAWFLEEARHKNEIKGFSTGTLAPVYSPFNEISFISWAAAENLHVCRNDQRNDGGMALKRQMVRATLAGSDAIRRVQPAARLLQCEPLIKVAAPPGDELLAQRARDINESQYETWDMLAGRREPELGGTARHLDLIGVNYYHNNQWRLDMPLEWHLGDPRRTPLSKMLVDLCDRYERPVLISETSHVGSGRGAWINHVAQEVARAIVDGARIQGVCIYPIVDRPDWDDGTRWHNSGLWDVEHQAGFTRVLAPYYAAGLESAQNALNNFSRSLTSSFQKSDQQSDQQDSYPMETIIVFSHLRWDFVYQRPQHLLSRLAQHYRVIFFEEPVHDNAEPFLQTWSPAANITVARPHTPSHFPGFHDEQLPYLKKMVGQLDKQYPDAIVWFYTPMALPLLDALSPRAVVYDCMDELAAFANAPRQLIQRENSLLKAADIVFAGGPSLYRGKKDRHANVHCFSSSVDVVHFAQALDRGNSHPAQADIARPRLGFYGVIDERFDAPLIGALADAHPEWQIVLVGPVVKIDPATLPRRANVHYLGQQNYESLPHFLAGWDVCLLPFALNESTKFISPTKTLEYLAAELPIVSAPIADVIELYGDVVAIADSHAAFIAACETALYSSAEERAAALPAMRETLATTSWDNTASRMHGLLQALVDKRAVISEMATRDMLVGGKLAQRTAGAPLEVDTETVILGKVAAEDGSLLKRDGIGRTLASGT